jgi:hypothetical protein
VERRAEWRATVSGEQRQVARDESNGESRGGSAAVIQIIECFTSNESVEVRAEKRAEVSTEVTGKRPEMRGERASGAS